MHAYRSHCALIIGYTGRHPALFSVLAYCMASMFLTWPLLFNSSSVLFGAYGDSYGGIWWLWAKINGLLNAPINHLIAEPFGILSDRGFSQPIAEWLPIILARLSNEIVAYNFFVFLSFPLTAIATYFLLASLLYNKLAAFVGGLVFGFCPAALLQAVGGHAAFAFNVFIPLFLWALFYNRAHRTLLSALCVAVSFALVTFTALYFGYFAIFIAIFFAIYDYATNSKLSFKRLFLNYALIALFAFILIIPFQYKIILHILSTSQIELAKAGQIRDYGELIVYSARPLDYFLPSIDHPVLGRFIDDISINYLHGSNFFEQTLYLGFTPLLLCLAGFFLWSKKHDNLKKQRYFLFFGSGALLMLLLAMPPMISFGNMQVPMVSHFMYKIAPMFRVYARFGILANFFMACAAAVVLAELSQRMGKIRYYLLLAVLLPVLMFEYWSIPPHAAHAVDTPPAVYQWLAQEPGDIIIAEYPMMNPAEASFYTYLFWQRIHKKRMVNGANPGNQKAWEFYELVHDLTDPETPQLLKSVGVKYIIVHKEMYREGQIPEQLKRYYPPDVSAAQYNGGKAPVNSSLKKPFKVFGDDIVYLLDN